jgi:hypothetical protein
LRLDDHELLATSSYDPAVHLEQLVDQIDSALRTAGEPGRAEREKAYLKSELDHYGASVPAVRG